MTATRKPVPTSTRWILTVATSAALLALLAAAIVFDEKTEAGGATQTVLPELIGLLLGPAVFAAAAGSLLLKRRPRHRLLLPIALIAMAYGTFATWLFFMETSQLPVLSPW